MGFKRSKCSNSITRRDLSVFLPVLKPPRCKLSNSMQHSSGIHGSCTKIVHSLYIGCFMTPYEKNADHHTHIHTYTHIHIYTYTHTHINTYTHTHILT